MADDLVTIWNSSLKFGRKPGNGELLIGDGTGFKLATITAGSNISINNTSGGIEITATTDTSGFVPTTRTLTASTGLTGGGDLSANRSFALADTAVTPGSYTSANITVDQQGRITAASNGPAAPSVSTKASNQTVTSSTTFVDLTGISFAIGANEHFVFNAIIFYSSGGGGIKFAVNGPAGFSSLKVSTGTLPYVTAYNTNVVLTSATGTTGIFTFFGYIINGATPGTFTFRFAQNTSNATGCSVDLGSYITYTKIA